MSTPHRIALFLALLALAAAPAAAQHDTASAPSITIDPGPPVPLVGRVVDARSGEPLRAVSVKLPNARVSVFTDEQGRFAARAPAGTYGSVVSVLGYRTRAGIWEVAAGDTPRVVRLERDPVVLQGLVVQARRIERRIRAAGTMARAYDRDALVNTGYPNVTQFVFAQGQLSFTSCGSLAVPSLRQPGGRFEPGAMPSAAPECVRVRGSAVRPCVILDEAPSSFSQLSAYRPQELYRLEVYGGGGTIVAYTADFARRIARSPVALPPLPMLTSLLCSTR